MINGENNDAVGRQMFIYDQEPGTEKVLFRSAAKFCKQNTFSGSSASPTVLTRGSPAPLTK